jgi:hypothetical protein
MYWCSTGMAGILSPEAGGALRVVAGGGDHMLGADRSCSSEGTRLPPFSTIFVAVTSQWSPGPGIAVDLPLALDLDAALAGALGHGLVTSAGLM